MPPSRGQALHVGSAEEKFPSPPADAPLLQPPNTWWAPMSAVPTGLPAVRTASLGVQGRGGCRKLWLTTCVVWRWGFGDTEEAWQLYTGRFALCTQSRGRVCKHAAQQNELKLEIHLEKNKWYGLDYWIKHSEQSGNTWTGQHGSLPRSPVLWPGEPCMLSAASRAALAKDAREIPQNLPHPQYWPY